jgi:hypothetical protein
VRLVGPEPRQERPWASPVGRTLRDAAQQQDAMEERVMLGSASAPAELAASVGARPWPALLLAALFSELQRGKLLVWALPVEELPALGARRQREPTSSAPRAVAGASPGCQAVIPRPLAALRTLHYTPRIAHVRPLPEP